MSRTWAEYGRRRDAIDSEYLAAIDKALFLYDRACRRSQLDAMAAGVFLGAHTALWAACDDAIQAARIRHAGAVRALDSLRPSETPE